MFMAFLLRENPIGDWQPEVLLGIIIGAAGFGNAIGIALASVLKNLNPAATVVLALLADAVMVLLAAFFYGVVTLALLGLTAGLAQSLAKLSLDSTIQRDVPERVRTSAFARSDTTLQLAWVIGGFVGIALPLNPALGLAVASVTLVAWVVLVLVSSPNRTRRTAEPPPQIPAHRRLIRHRVSRRVRQSLASSGLRRALLDLAPDPGPRKLGPGGARAPSSSSSSASARSSLATGAAALRSGWRPWR